MQRNVLTRREFLRRSAVAGGAVVLAACAPQPTPTPQVVEVTKVVEKEVEVTKVVEVEKEKEVVITATPAPREKVKMIVWTNDRYYSQSFQNRSGDFAAMHPDKEFEFTVEENPDLGDNLASLVMSGLEGVDIVALERGPITRLWKEGLAEEGLVSLSEYLTPEQIEGNTRWEMFSWNGKTYAVSAEMDLVGWYYQPAIFEKHGIDVEAIKTYDDFKQAGRKLAENGVYMILCEDANMGGQTGTLEMLALQNDGGYFDAKGEVLIDSPQTIEAVQLGYDLIKDKIALANNKVFEPASMKTFADGLVAGVFMADWFLDFLLKDLLPDMAGQWRARSLPIFKEGGRNVSTRGGTGFAIPKGSKHPDLAWDLIRVTYLDKENMIKIYLETHYFPPMKACWGDPRVTSVTDPYVGGQKVGELWSTLAPQVPYDYTHEYKAEAVDIAAKEAIVPIFAGEKTVEQGLKDAADAVRQLIG